MLGYPELILILAVVLLIFGPSKLPEMARALGSAMREFQKAASELEAQTKQLENPITLPPPKTVINNEFTSVPSPPEKTISAGEGFPEQAVEQEKNLQDIKSESELKNIASMLDISREGKTSDQLRDEIMNRVRSLGKNKEEVE